MHKTCLLTLSGDDRPGIMDFLATTLLQHGGNWLESRLAHLGSQFAGVVRFEIDDENLDALRHDLQQQVSDLNVAIRIESTAGEVSAGRPADVTVLGLDQPGIVSALVSALAAQGINVEDFRSSTESAAMSGELLFRAVVSILIPENQSDTSIQQALDKIAAQLDLEVDLATHQ